MKQTTSFQIVVFAAFLFVTATLQAAPTCGGLIGTWKATYTIGSTYTDTLIIKSVSTAGVVYAINQWGDPLHGYCKNGTVEIIEDHSDYFLNGYYFTNEASGFGRHNGTFSYLYDFQTSRHSAKIRKVSTSTRLFKMAGTRDQMASEGYMKLQEEKELQNK